MQEAMPTFRPHLHPRFLLTRRVGTGVFGLATCAALVGACHGLHGAGALAVAKAAEDELWRQGTPAHVRDDYQVEASELKLFLRYEAEFTYVEPGGREHRGTVDVTTMFYDPIRFNTPPGVRYDPDHPDRYVTSWQVNAGWNRLGLPLTLLVGLSAAGAGLARETRRIARRLAVLQRACPFSDWELVTLPARRVDGAHGTTAWRYVAPSEDEGALAEHEYWAGGTPLLIGEDGTSIAGLRLASAPAVVVPLADDLRPFLFSVGDAASLRASLARLAAG